MSGTPKQQPMSRAGRRRRHHRRDGAGAVQESCTAPACSVTPAAGRRRSDRAPTAYLSRSPRTVRHGRRRVCGVANRGAGPGGPAGQRSSSSRCVSGAGLAAGSASAVASCGGGQAEREVLGSHGRVPGGQDLRPQRRSIPRSYVGAPGQSRLPAWVGARGPNVRAAQVMCRKISAGEVKRAGLGAERGSPRGSGPLWLPRTGARPARVDGDGPAAGRAATVPCSPDPPGSNSQDERRGTILRLSRNHTAE
jgi:hypothetical protein